MPNRGSRLPAALAILGPISGALAVLQPEGRPTDEGTPITSRFTAPGGDFRFSLTPRGQYAFSADLDDSPGSVSVARAEIDAQFSLSINERLGLSLSVLPEVSWYSFSDASGLIPGTDEPFDDLYRLDIVPGVRYALDRDWALTGGFLLQFAGESDADVGDSVTYGGFAGVRYRFSDRFSATFGALGKTRLEDSAIILPLVGVEWAITNTLNLSTSGTGVKITNTLDDNWAVWFAGAYESRDYRLADDGPLPSGVVRDSRVPLKIGLDWSPNPGLKVSLEGGAIIWQEFEIDTRDSDTIAQDNTDPAPYVGLSVQLRF